MFEESAEVNFLREGLGKDVQAGEEGESHENQAIVPNVYFCSLTLH